MALGRAMSSGLVKFGEEFELDLQAYELRQSGQRLKLERVPTEVLLLLIEQLGTARHVRSAYPQMHKRIDFDPVPRQNSCAHSCNIVTLARKTI
jgi:hypothetical protein